MKLSTLALIGAAIAGGTAFAIVNKPLGVTDANPVLVELFTSQGCSSCPPADELAEELSHEAGLVVVTRPVTYWDRLGWKDTLGREENTALQRAYAARGLAGNNGVYTPQIVVDGARGTVGSNAMQVRQFIRQSAGAPATLAVKPAAGGYSVAIAGDGKAHGELVLMALSPRETVAIGGGENGGRRITYTNVLRSERKLADWQGGQRTVAIPAVQVRAAGASRFALVLRQPNGGAVLAARMLPAA